MKVKYHLNQEPGKRIKVKPENECWDEICIKEIKNLNNIKKKKNNFKENRENIYLFIIYLHNNKLLYKYLHRSTIIRGFQLVSKRD